MWPMSIAELVPASAVAAKHADALLELAFLVSAVDGHLADEELAAFSAIFGRLKGHAATKQEIGDLLERFVMTVQTTLLEDRLSEVAKTLPVELREPAFTVAVALGLADGEESEHEGELVGVLAKVLGLDARATALTADARKAAGL